MSPNQFRIYTLLIFVVTYSSCTDHMSIITPVRKLVIDTDAGVDDAVAILLVLEAERLDHNPEVLGITCVNGNAPVDVVALNVLKTLDVANRLDIPVYKGATHPLVLPDKKDFYFGNDGFGDFYYPNPPSPKLIQEKHAVNAMIDLVKAHPGTITLLALGPLTNLALAIRMYPEFLQDLQQLIVMGGSTEGRGNIGIYLEYNFFVDPAANYVVFSSSNKQKLTILVPWETTERSSVTTKFRMSLSKSNTSKIRLLDTAGASHLNMEHKYWISADAVTSVVAITSGSSVTKSALCYSELIYDGTTTRGMIIVDCGNVTKNPINTLLIQEVHVEIYKRLLIRYLTLP